MRVQVAWECGCSAHGLTGQLWPAWISPQIVGGDGQPVGDRVGDRATELVDLSINELDSDTETGQHDDVGAAAGGHRQVHRGKLGQVGGDAFQHAIEQRDQRRPLR
jgi:hypothetical protein